MNGRSADTTEPVGALCAAYLEAYLSEACEELERQSLADVVAFIGTLPVARAAKVLEELSDQLSVDCLSRLDREVLRGAVAEMDPVRLSLILGRIPAPQREAVLQQLPGPLGRELRDMMSYPPNCAGAFMDTRVLTFRPRTRVKEALARLAAWHRRDVRYVFVVQSGGEFQAMLPIAELALASPRQRLADLVKEPPPSINVVAPREEIEAALAGTDVKTLPVLDAGRRLLGVIRQDALIQAVKEQATGDLATLVGASTEEGALSSPWFAVRKRLPWLNINLLTAFLAAAVVGIFEGTIAKYTALAVLLPVVAGQAGNTGAQALAVVIRGLALREIRARHWGPVLRKEALVGVVNGLVIALVTAAGTFVWSRSLGLCLVIFVAMVLSMVLAGLAGASIPLLLSAFRQDPAQSGSIILTTVTDITGFFSFLGLATLLTTLL